MLAWWFISTADNDHKENKATVIYCTVFHDFFLFLHFQTNMETNSCPLCE